MTMTYSTILDCQDIYFALFIFSTFGQAGACGITWHSVVGLRRGKMGKRSDVKERDIVSDPDIYNSLESE